MNLNTKFDLGDKIQAISHVYGAAEPAPFQPYVPYVVQRIDHSYWGTFYHLINITNGETKKYPVKTVDDYCQKADSK